jgi:hypothetical protein
MLFVKLIKNICKSALWKRMTEQLYEFMIVSASGVLVFLRKISIPGDQARYLSVLFVWIFVMSGIAGISFSLDLGPIYDPVLVVFDPSLLSIFPPPDNQSRDEEVKVKVPRIPPEVEAAINGRRGWDWEVCLLVGGAAVGAVGVVALICTTLLGGGTVSIDSSADIVPFVHPNPTLLGEGTASIDSSADIAEDVVATIYPNPTDYPFWVANVCSFYGGHGTYDMTVAGRDTIVVRDGWLQPTAVLVASGLGPIIPLNALGLLRYFPPGALSADE